MPKKLNPEMPEEQAKRFRKEAGKQLRVADATPDACETSTGALVI